MHTVLVNEHYAVIPIQADITDDEIDSFQKSILNDVNNKKVAVVFIDLTLLTIIDSFLGDKILATAKMIKLLGCFPILIGISPQVASALIMLDFDTQGIKTAKNLQAGLALFNKGKYGDKNKK